VQGCRRRASGACPGLHRGRRRGKRAAPDGECRREVRRCRIRARSSSRDGAAAGLRRCARPRSGIVPPSGPRSSRPRRRHRAASRRSSHAHATSARLPRPRCRRCRGPRQGPATTSRRWRGEQPREDACGEVDAAQVCVPSPWIARRGGGCSTRSLRTSTPRVRSTPPWPGATSRKRSSAVRPWGPPGVEGRGVRMPETGYLPASAWYGRDDGRRLLARNTGRAGGHKGR
jgi:hypothetical protein